MDHHNENLRDAEFGPVIDRLGAERPTASALELDAIKGRVHTRVARTARRSGRTTEFMRSRLAILAMLVLGLVMSTGGASLAISGFAGPTGNAAETQYGGKDDDDVLGEEEDNGPAGGGQETPAGGTEGETSGNGVQPTRQVEAGAQGGGSEELPFTGFAAIPILLGGVALLTTGLVLRRRTADGS